MSANIGGGQQDISRLVNQYKEIVKTSGGNVDSLKDEEIASIFSKDLSDNAINFQYQEDGQTKSLFDNIDPEKVPQDKIEELTKEITKLMGGAEAANGGEDNPTVAANGKYDENDLYSMNNYAISLHGDNANKAEARDKYDAFQELKEKGYDAIKEKYADDERFQIFEKISKHPDYKASSEEQRQAGVLNRMASALLEDIAIAKGPDKEREIKIEIPSIKPKLSEEEQKLAQDIADGKVEINGWGVDHQHPFQKMDSLAINRVTNAATRIKIDREQGKASAADEAGKSDKADKAEKTNKNDEANKADKADKANKADAENKTSGKSADVDPTKSNDDGEKYGIAHFKDMAPKEQKKALKALVKDLKVKYKEAKKSGTQREINDAKEAYENKKAIYDSMFPNRTMDWVKFGLNLVTGGLLDKFIPSSVDTGARIARTLINASEVGK